LDQFTKKKKKEKLTLRWLNESNNLPKQATVNDVITSETIADAAKVEKEFESNSKKGNVYCAHSNFSE